MARARKKPATGKARKKLPPGMMLAHVVDPGNIGSMIPILRRMAHPLDHAMARGRITQRQHGGYLRYEALRDAARGAAPSGDMGGGSGGVSATDAGANAKMATKLRAAQHFAALEAYLGRRAAKLAEQVITRRVAPYTIAANVDGVTRPSHRTLQVVLGAVSHMLDDCASFVVNGVEEG